MVTEFNYRLSGRDAAHIFVGIVQAFRWPLELMMHRAYERGIMPVQMGYSGRNFDILNGMTAVIVALVVAVGLGGRRVVAAWNLLGLALLLNIVVIAILSTPLVAYFGPIASTSGSRSRPSSGSPR